MACVTVNLDEKCTSSTRCISLILHSKYPDASPESISTQCKVECDRQLRIRGQEDIKSYILHKTFNFKGLCSLKITLMLHWRLAKTASKNTWTIYFMVQLANQSRSILQCACHDHSKADKNFLSKKADVLQKRTMDRGQSKKKLLVWWKVKTLHKATIEKQDLIGFKENRLKLLNSSPYRKKWVTRDATALLNFFA